MDKSANIPWTQPQERVGLIQQARLFAASYTLHIEAPIEGGLKIEIRPKAPMTKEVQP